jgi:hypothetical protein
LLPPLLAAALGLALGGVLVLASKRAVRLMTPDDPAIGMAKVLLINTLIMGTALLGLFAFYVWDRPALAWFGLALVVGFLSVASIELLRFGSAAMPRASRRR